MFLLCLLFFVAVVSCHDNSKSSKSLSIVSNSQSSSSVTNTDVTGTVSNDSTPYPFVLKVGDTLEVVYITKVVFPLEVGAEVSIKFKNIRTSQSIEVVTKLFDIGSSSNSPTSYLKGKNIPFLALVKICELQGIDGSHLVNLYGFVYFSGTGASNICFCVVSGEGNDSLAGEGRLVTWSSILYGRYAPFIHTSVILYSNNSDAACFLSGELGMASQEAKDKLNGWSYEFSGIKYRE